MTRYTIGTMPEETDEIVVCDHQTHHIILRGGKMGLPDVQELLRLANTAPAWRSRPTVPGRWLVAESAVTGWEVWNICADDIADADKLGGEVGGRWFGPIPEDVG